MDYRSACVGLVWCFDCRDMASVEPNDPRAEANRKLGLKLLWIVAGALVFAFALVPLYDVLCSVTGLNGKTKNMAATGAHQVDKTRWVKVEFMSSVMPGLAWEFHPKVNSIKVHPGQVETVLFEAKNMTNVAVAGQAVPSVSPGKASPHLKKIECFCFQRQVLKPGETKLMPLRFYVSPEVPADIDVVTLSYAFFSAVKTEE